MAIRQTRVRHLARIALASLGLIFASPSLAAPPQVKTEAGLVSGKLEGDLQVYRGLPFAQAPVGALRWQPAQPATPWTGVLKANETRLWASIETGEEVLVCPECHGKLQRA